MAATTSIRTSGVWRTATALGLKTSGVWRNITIGYTRVGGVWKTIFQANLTATISANTTIQNMRTLAIAAGWNQVDVVNFILTINSGIYVRATTTANYALDTGTPWPATSTLTLINGGYVQGKGGLGGNGEGVSIVGTAGAAGGHAINLQYNLSIDNANGYILGGGGGGGGGSRVDV